MLKHRQNRRRGERGAVLVEAAIVLPVVLTLLLGVIEFGFVWKDKLALSTGVRAGARVGSADGTNGAADYDILRQIKSAIGGLDVKRVIIWDATASSSLPSTCTAVTPPANTTSKAGVPGVCNVYGPAWFVSSYTISSSSFNCATSSSSVDWNWCPNNPSGTNGPRIDSRTGNGGLALTTSASTPRSITPT